MNIIFLSIFILVFINFEIYYYLDYSKKLHSGYEDIELYNITNILENDSKTKELEKYIIVNNKAEPYMYTLVQNKISPYEFDKTKEIKKIKTEKSEIKILTKYKNYNFPIYKSELQNLDFEKEKYVFVLDKKIKDAIEFIESKNYFKQEYKFYCVLKPEI